MIFHCLFDVHFLKHLFDDAPLVSFSLFFGGGGGERGQRGLYK